MDVKKNSKVAIVGATTKSDKFGNIVLRDLIKKGFAVIPVNPRYDIIEGLPVCKDVSQLPEDTDLIVFIVPPDVGMAELKKAYEKGFRKFWFQPGAESEEIIDYVEGLENSEVSFKKCIMVETASM